MTNDDAAQQIWDAFSQNVQAQQEPTGDYFGTPPGYTDPDPSTTYDPHPEVQAIQDTVAALDPDSFGGIYQTSDGVVHVGLTSTVPQAAPAAAPGTTVNTFTATYSWSDLLTIADVLVDQMASDSTGTIVSVTPDAPSNSVVVGVTDLNSAIATEIKIQYGGAVTIVGDEPIQDV